MAKAGLRIEANEKVEILPVNITWVVIFIPTTTMLAPDVNTTSAASGSP